MIYTTIQVSPRGDTFFHNAGYEDHHRIEPMVFYALLLTGELSTDEGPLSIEHPPRTVLTEIRDSPEIEELLTTRKRELTSCRYLLEFYNKLSLLRRADTTLAAKLCIFRHLQFERERRKRR